MKTLIIGDGHDKWTTITPLVDAVIKRYDVDRLVIMGDLTNDWDISPRDEVSEIQHLHDWLHENKGLRTDVLMGNHDAYYLIAPSDHSRGADEVKNFSPGHLFPLKGDVRVLLTTLPSPLKAATTIRVNGREWLLTHAGVTAGWARQYASDALKIDSSVKRDNMVDASALSFMLMHNDDPTMLGGDRNDDIVGVSVRKLGHIVNRMLEVSDWDHLYMIGPGRGGFDVPSPLWADKDELLGDSLPGLSQIVGHTPVPTVESWVRPRPSLASTSSRKSDGKREPHDLIFVDTMSTMSTGERIGDWTALLCDNSSAEPFKTVSLENPGMLTDVHTEWDSPEDEEAFIRAR